MSTEKEYNERKTLDELERALSKVNIKEIHELNAYLDDVMFNS